MLLGFTNIEIRPGRRSGKPCIVGTRITVGDILGWLSGGMTAEEIVDDFPELSKDDVLEALAYAAARENRTLVTAA